MCKLVIVVYTPGMLQEDYDSALTNLGIKLAVNQFFEVDVPICHSYNDRDRIIKETCARMLFLNDQLALIPLAFYQNGLICASAALVGPKAIPMRGTMSEVILTKVEEEFQWLCVLLTKTKANKFKTRPLLDFLLSFE